MQNCAIHGCVESQREREEGALNPAGPGWTTVGTLPGSWPSVLGKEGAGP